MQFNLRNVFFVDLADIYDRVAEGARNQYTEKAIERKR